MTTTTHDHRAAQEHGEPFAQLERLANGDITGFYANLAPLPKIGVADGNMVFPQYASPEPTECEPIRTTIKKKKGVEPNCTCNFCIRMRELYMEYGWFSLFMAK